MPVLYMERSSLEGLTETDIKKIIDENEGHVKYQRLERYYAGDHDILHVVKKDSTAPNKLLDASALEGPGLFPRSLHLHKGQSAAGEQ